MKPTMTKVKSSNIDSIGYRDGDLYVQFHDGAVYKHKDVPPDMFQAMKDTDSAGKFYHGRIKGKFQSEKLNFEDPQPVRDDNGNPHPMNPEAEKDDEFLLGSNVQPATFRLADGTELQLGEVVRRAYDLSGMKTAKEWNALPGDTQEHFIQKIVDELDLYKETPVATIRVNGGEKHDFFSEAGQKLFQQAVAQAKESGEVPTISFNDGPEHPIGSPEAEAAYEALKSQVA